MTATSRQAGSTAPENTLQICLYNQRRKCGEEKTNFFLILGQTSRPPSLVPPLTLYGLIRTAMALLKSYAYYQNFGPWGCKGWACLATEHTHNNVLKYHVRCWYVTSSFPFHLYPCLGCLPKCYSSRTTPMKQDVDPVPTALCVCGVFPNLFTWLHQVLVAALGSAIFLEACQLFGLPHANS